MSGRLSRACVTAAGVVYRRQVRQIVPCLVHSRSFSEKQDWAALDAKPDRKAGDSAAALHDAVEDGDLAMIKMLIKNGVNVDKVCCENYIDTALCLLFTRRATL